MTTRERSHSDVFENIKQIVKINILHFKLLLKNKTMIFMLFFLPVIILLGVGILIPEWDILSSAYGLMEIIILGIVFGNLRYSINKSTLGDNISLSYIKRWHILISSVITLFVVSFLVFNIQLLVEMIFESVNFIFTNTFVFYGENAIWNMDIVWKDLNYSPIYLFFFQTFMLNIAIYSLVGHYFHTQKTFLIFVLSYFFIVLTLGGVVSMIWDGWYYFEDKGKGEFISGAKKGLAFETYPADPTKFELNNPTFQFKNWMDYTPFLIPQWFNNQHFFNAFRVGAIQTNVNPGGLNSIYPANGLVKWMYWSDIDPFWNVTMVAPYVYTIVISLFSLFTGRAILRK